MATALGMSSSPVLAVRGLTKRYGERTVVDNVSFEIARGETYGLLGPNGAGKTTIISMVCGLLAPESGSVSILGEPLDGRHVERKAAIGLVPQDLALYPDLSARENLVFFGRLQGLPKKRLSARMTEVLELVGLADRADDRVDSYSGGMKRRCNIAVGLLHEPQLLILDEPTVGVDPQSRNAILESIERLGGEGLSVLYTTHYMEEAERLCRRVGIVDEGHLVAQGTTRELLDLIGEQAHLRISGSGALDALARLSHDLPGITRADVVDGGLEIVVADPTRVLAPLVEAADRAGVSISGVEVSESDLETVFLRLTGKALRD